MLRFSSRQGQTILEYLLVTTLTACLVFYAMAGKNHMFPDLFNEANLYYEKGGKALSGGYFNSPTNLTNPANQGTLTVREPTPVVGGWCPWGSCIEGYQERECACPRPMFTDSYCNPDGEGGPVKTCAGGGMGGAGCVATDCLSNSWECGNSVLCPAVSCGTCSTGWNCVGHTCTCTPSNNSPCQDNGCGVINPCPNPSDACNIAGACVPASCMSIRSCLPNGPAGNPCGVSMYNECNELCSCDGASGLICGPAGVCCSDTGCVVPGGWAPLDCNSYFNSSLNRYETAGLTGCGNPCTVTMPAGSCSCGDGFCADTPVDPINSVEEDCWSCPQDCGYATCGCSGSGCTAIGTTASTGCPAPTIMVCCDSGVPRFCMSGQPNCGATPVFGGDPCLPCNGGSGWTAQFPNPNTGNPSTVTCAPSGNMCFFDCPGCAGVCLPPACFPATCCWGNGICCVPNCAGRCGGPDGCGGTCPNNCVLPQTCGGGGTPNVCGCTPACAGLCGGAADGCGGGCGNCPGQGVTSCCLAQACAAQACGSRVCGPDPVCGLSCGTCPPSDTCNGVGQCVVKSCYRCQPMICRAGPGTCYYEIPVTFYQNVDGSTPAVSCNLPSPACDGHVGSGYLQCTYGAWGVNCP